MSKRFVCVIFAVMFLALFGCAGQENSSSDAQSGDQQTIDDNHIASDDQSLKDVVADGDAAAGNTSKDQCQSEGAWITSKVNSAGNIGYTISIGVDHADRPHLAYNDEDGFSHVVHTYYNGSTWISDKPWGELLTYNPSIAIDSLDRVHIAALAEMSGGYYNMLLHAFLEGGIWRYRFISMGYAIDTPYLIAGIDKTVFALIRSNTFQFNAVLEASRFNGRGSWSPEVDYPVDVYGTVNALSGVVDSQNDPYFVFTMGGLVVPRPYRYAFKQDGAWRDGVVKPYLLGVCDSAMAILSDDTPILAYSNSFGSLILSFRNDKWQIVGWLDTGFAAIIDIKADACDNLHLVYSSGEIVKTAYYYATNRTGNWQTTLINDSMTNITDAALAVDNQGRPHIAVIDPTLQTIEYAYFAPDER